MNAAGFYLRKSWVPTVCDICSQPLPPPWQGAHLPTGSRRWLPGSHLACELKRHYAKYLESVLDAAGKSFFHSFLTKESAIATTWDGGTIAVPKLKP